MTDAPMDEPSFEGATPDRLRAPAPQISGRSVHRTLHSGLALAEVDGVPLCRHRLRHRLADHVAKRVLDIVVSFALIVLLSPLLVLIGAAVALTSAGPVLFVQARQGFLGRSFRIYKFRTLHSEVADETGVSQVRDGDTRVTALGRLLRRTSLDELPQLFNILKGDMSLVGPRPHVPNMLAAGRRYDKLVPYYRLRLLARPGLTGWAQANGLRGPTDDPGLARARIDHDIAYVQNFSFVLDLHILLRTAWREMWRLGGH